MTGDRISKMNLRQSGKYNRKHGDVFTCLSPFNGMSERWDCTVRFRYKYQTQGEADPAHDGANVCRTCSATIPRHVGISPGDKYCVNSVEGVDEEQRDEEDSTWLR